VLAFYNKLMTAARAESWESARSMDKLWHKGNNHPEKIAELKEVFKECQEFEAYVSDWKNNKESVDTISVGPEQLNRLYHWCHR